MARDLKVSLVVSAIDKATRPIKKIQRAISTLTRKTGLDLVARRIGDVAVGLKGVANQAVTTVSMVGAAAAGIAAASAVSVRSYAEDADEIAKAAGRLRIPIDDLRTTLHAFDLGGVNKQQTLRALQEFQNSVADTFREPKGTKAKIFQQIGIRLVDADGKEREPLEIWNDFVDAIANQKTHFDALEGSTELMGRRLGPYMKAVMLQGAEGIKASGEEILRLRPLTEEHAKEAENFIDQQLRLTESIRGVRDALAQEYIVELTNSMTALTNFITEHRPQTIEEFKKTVNSLGNAWKWVSEKIDGVSGAIVRLREDHKFIDDMLTSVEQFAESEGWGTVFLIIAGFILFRKTIWRLLKVLGPLWWLLGAILGVLWKLKTPIVGLARLIRGKLRPQFRGLSDDIKKANEQGKKFKDGLKPPRTPRGNMPSPEEARARLSEQLKFVVKRSPLAAGAFGLLRPSKLADATMSSAKGILPLPQTQMVTFENLNRSVLDTGKIMMDVQEMTGRLIQKPIRINIGSDIAPQTLANDPTASKWEGRLKVEFDAHGREIRRVSVTSSDPAMEIETDVGYVMPDAGSPDGAF